MSGNRQFVDTNVLVYAHDVTAGDKHTRARALVEELWETREGPLSVQVLQEFLVTTTRKIPRPLDAPAAARIIDDLALVAAAGRQDQDGTLAALTFARVWSLNVVRREVCDVPERRWRLTSRGWPRWRVPMFRVPVFRRARPTGSDSWAWLEPYPGPPRDAPAEPSMSLAYVAALQRLPPRERAALLLSDVLDFAAAEVAEILDCDVAEVDQMLVRARTETGGAPRPSLDEDAVVTRFKGAFERGDVASITALLTRNASLRMRPLPPGPTGSPPSAAT